MVALRPELPPPHSLREGLWLDEATGLLWWKERPLSHFKSQHDANAWNGQHAGKPAFRSVDRDGYLSGFFWDRRYRAHRVIWAMVTDFWPVLQIDHRDGNRANNRFSNLRQATVAQQRQNETSRNPKLKGVYLNNGGRHRVKTYQARIQVAGKVIYLGTYPTAEEAHAAYVAAAVKHFGEFARAA